jgi:hypothetical protein
MTPFSVGNRELMIRTIAPLDRIGKTRKNFNSNKLSSRTRMCPAILARRGRIVKGGSETTDNQVDGKSPRVVHWLTAGGRDGVVEGTIPTEISDD